MNDGVAARVRSAAKTVAAAQRLNAIYIHLRDDVRSSAWPDESR